MATTDSSTAAAPAAAAPAATTAANPNGGIVAIDHTEHAQGKTLFASLKSRAVAAEASLEEDFAKLKELLHL